MGKLDFRVNGNKCELVMVGEESTNVLVDFSYNLTEKPTPFYIEGITKIINSFNELSGKFNCSIFYWDIIAIVSSLFNYMLKTNGKNIKILELGHSIECYSYYEAVTLKLFSEKNKLFAYIKPQDGLDLSKQVNHFNEMMNTLTVSKQIVTIASESNDDLHALRDDYFDCIFIKEKEYGLLLNEMVEAIKKIKPGGLLIGNYSDCYFNQLPFEIQNKGFVNVETKDGSYHTGVIYALKVFFDDNYEKPITGSSIWTKSITPELKEKILSRFSYQEERKVLQQLVNIGNLLNQKLRNIESTIEEEKQNIDSLLEDIGMAITDSEIIATELAYFLGFEQLKKFIIQVKERYVDIVISYDQNDSLKVKENIEKVLIPLELWINELNKINHVSRWIHE